MYKKFKKFYFTEFIPITNYEKEKLKYFKLLNTYLPITITICFEFTFIPIIQYLRKKFFELRTNGVQGVINHTLNQKSELIKSVHRCFYIYVSFVLFFNFSLYICHQDILLKLKYEKFNDIDRKVLLENNDNLLFNKYPYEKEIYFNSNYEGKKTSIEPNSNSEEILNDENNNNQITLKYLMKNFWKNFKNINWTLRKPVINNDDINKNNQVNKIHDNQTEYKNENER